MLGWLVWTFAVILPPALIGLSVWREPLPTEGEQLP